MRQGKPRVLAVVGAQYGSEGKGAVIRQLADHFEVHVRTGGPNAGHTLWHVGKAWKMRSIPCGWVNRNAVLVIGAGAIISPEVLLQEIEAIKQVDSGIEDRLYIDSRAWCIDERDRLREQAQSLGSRIGSTLEGVGAGRSLRMWRDSDMDRRAGAVLGGSGLLLVDTVRLLRTWMESSVMRVLLEGTQGLGLSLTHGVWPFVTSHDTTPAQLAADAGIPCHRVRTLLVARTYPIRVAGNSGPLFGELTWEEMSKLVGRSVEERTTVTNRVRRIGRWDGDLFDRALALTGARRVVITFVDYMDQRLEGETQVVVLQRSPVASWIAAQEEQRGIKVVMVGTGGPEFNFIHRHALSSWL